VKALYPCLEFFKKRDMRFGRKRGFGKILILRISSFGAVRNYEVSNAILSRQRVVTESKVRRMVHHGFIPNFGDRIAGLCGEFYPRLASRVQ
jgi:hypothetical protein